MADHCIRHDGHGPRWVVARRPGDAVPLAVHATELEALRDAVRRCRESGGGRVGVFDARGRRVREAPVGGRLPGGT